VPDERVRTFYLELSADTLRDVRLQSSLTYKRKGG
jgi:hypothetical protein